MNRARLAHVRATEFYTFEPQSAPARIARPDLPENSITQHAKCHLKYITGCAKIRGQAREGNSERRKEVRNGSSQSKPGRAARRRLALEGACPLRDDRHRCRTA